MSADQSNSLRVERAQKPEICRENGVLDSRRVGKIACDSTPRLVKE
jgi:hypothetical protein